MTDEFSKEDRIAFLRKKNEARKIASGLDWEKDKAMSYGSKPGYRYLSVEKMKRNLLPVFMNVGLDFKLDYESIEDRGELGSMPVHWTIACKATLTDIDTGYSETTTVFGESGDVLDKGLSKASTYALKTWLADTFMLIDGVDPDMAPESVPVKFIPRTDKEQDEIRSKAFANGVKPEEPAEEPKEEPKPKKMMKDSGDPLAKPKEEEKKPGEVAIEKLKEEAVASFKPTVPQQNMINNILAKWSEKAKNGEITAEEYEQFSKDMSEIHNNSMAVAFIKKYRSA